MSVKATPESELDSDDSVGWSLDGSASRLAHLMWETGSLICTSAESAIAHTPLSKASLGCLMRVAATPGITVSEIARASFHTQQSISQIVARLERLGYVERQLGPGRGIGLYTTAEGEAAMLEGDALETKHEHELSELLGAGRYETLRQLLIETRAVLREHRAQADSSD